MAKQKNTQKQKETGNDVESILKEVADAAEAEAKAKEAEEEAEAEVESEETETEELSQEVCEEASDEETEDPWKEKFQRTMAEFENFRRRSEKEKSSMYDMGAKDIIGKILPVLDNFERGLASIPEDQKDDPVASGMELIYRQFVTALEGMGVKAIEAVGTEFNPDFHNAVMHVEDEAAGTNEVVEEFQKGYLYKDSVIRYSMVKVAN